MKPTTATRWRLLLLALGLAALALPVEAQQTPQYTRFKYNNALLTRRPIVNFIGPVSPAACVDNPSFDQTDCTIGSGGGGSGTMTQLTCASGVSCSPATITGAGVVSLPPSGAAAGTYSNATVTVNDRGIVTNVANGSGFGFYQTVQSNGSAQAQRDALNFTPRFGLTDSSSPSRTTVDLASVISPGSCTNCSMTWDAYGRVTVAGTGGGSTTLAAAYAAGASDVDSTILLDSTRGPVTIRDNASPIGTLFQIQDDTGAVNHLSLYPLGFSVLNGGFSVDTITPQTLVSGHLRTQGTTNTYEVGSSFINFAKIYVRALQTDGLNLYVNSGGSNYWNFFAGSQLLPITDGVNVIGTASTKRLAGLYTQTEEVDYPLIGTSSDFGRGLLFKSSNSFQFGLYQYSSMAEFRSSTGDPVDPESGGQVISRWALQARNDTISLGSPRVTDRLALLYDAGSGTYTERGAFNYTRLGFLALESSGSIGINSGVKVYAQSTAADGASAIALQVNTTAAWSNATAKLLSLETNSVEKFYVSAAGQPNWITGNSQSTVGAAGAASALPALPTGYVKILVNGSSFVVPYYNPS